MDYEEIKKRDMEFLAGEKRGGKPQRKNNMIVTLLIALIVVVVLCAGVFAFWIGYNDGSKKGEDALSVIKTEEVDNVEETQKPKATATSAPTPTPTATPKVKRRGSWEPIPEDVRESMKGISYPANGKAKVSLDNLAYLTIPHYDFEGGIKQGKMIVAKSLADEVLDIFAELFDIQYPIERMELIDKYQDLITDEFDTLDRSSMGRNNTSCFCYRVVSGTDNLSYHAYGKAIDLNPKINPWVSSGGTVSPRNAKKYANRSGATKEDSDWTDVEKRAYIGKDTEVYKIFKKYGWEWGGFWNSRDYQHFQKS